jgi:hypothetical protein
MYISSASEVRYVSVIVDELIANHHGPTTDSMGISKDSPLAVSVAVNVADPAPEIGPNSTVVDPGVGIAVD